MTIRGSAHDNRDDGLVERALEFIAPSGQRVVWLGSPDVGAENFEYADLLRGNSLGRLVSSVVEKDGSPLLYIASIAHPDEEMARRLARLLGNRGETALLIDVHSERDSARVLARAWPCALEVTRPTVLDLTNPIDARSILGDLQEGLWSEIGGAHQEQRLRDLLVASVARVSSALSSANQRALQGNAGSQEVLALVGRALFARFLMDREILSEATAPELWVTFQGDESTAFSNPRSASAVCRWLDDTFNGEFMPLPARDGYEGYFASLFAQAPDALHSLGWIVGRTDAGGQMPLWDRLDFSHIPSGTLSEVYEDYAHRRAPRHARQKSIHFTPRHIARMMVRQALSGLPPDDAARAKLLDPAVGAAVFLSLAFRELAKLRAVQDGDQWPDTAVLREILYRQLRGMDINLDALHLAALTLYLTAIELDTNPVPPQKLRFTQPLLGTVLHDVSDGGLLDGSDAGLGSLRRHSVVGGGFDVVIGNPPWTSLGSDDAVVGVKPKKSLSRRFADESERIARACIAERCTIGENYEHPDKVPDIAFVWKATEWAKSGGVIALIVHQRLLIKRSRSWSIARRSLMNAIEIIGVLDAGEFANHDQLIWPGIESPFCILFARNRKPPADHRTLMLSLAVEPSLRNRRQLRLDPAATMLMSASDFDEEPGGFVARTKGCILDRELLRRWNDRCDDRFVPPSGIAPRRLPLMSLGAFITAFSRAGPGRGFKAGIKDTTEPVWFADLPADAREIMAKDRVAGSVDAAAITRRFVRRPLRSSPGRASFEPPLLLLRQAAGELGKLQRATLVTAAEKGPPVIYPFEFIGASVKDDEHSLLCAKYAALWINSAVFSYYQTLTSTQLTAGIKVLLSSEMMRTPIMDLRWAMEARLTDSEEIESMFERLGSTSSTLSEEIDAWVAKILALDTHEQVLIGDTLSVSYPIGPARHSGKRWLQASEQRLYLGQLKRDLTSASDVIDLESLCFVESEDSLEGWRFVTWSLKDHASQDTDELSVPSFDVENLLGLVKNSYPRGELWATAPGGHRLFGQLALRRQWLPSRAVLHAQLITAWADRENSRE